MLFIFVSLFATFGLAQTPPVNDLAAIALLEQVKKTYRECQSYQDEGEVRTTFRYSDDSMQTTLVMSFKTLFSRNFNFRLEFAERLSGSENSLYSIILYQHGKSIGGFSPTDASIGKVKRLDDLLLGSKSPSNGLSLKIPVLLQPLKIIPQNPKIVFNWFDVIESPQIIDNKEENSLDTIIVEGKLKTGGLTKLWIDKKRLVIVKVYEQISFSKDQIPSAREVIQEITTTYNPVFNQPIDQKRILEGIPASSK